MFIKYLQAVGIILVCISTCDWDLNKLILEFNAASIPARFFHNSVWEFNFGSIGKNI